MSRLNDDLVVNINYHYAMLCYEPWHRYIVIELQNSGEINVEDYRACSSALPSPGTTGTPLPLVFMKLIAYSRCNTYNNILMVCLQ